MKFDDDSYRAESISASIEESLGESSGSAIRHRIDQAERSGMFGRILALRGALSSGRTGDRGALEAAHSLARRVFVMATVYDLDDIRQAARSIEEGCDTVREGVQEGWADIEIALATLDGIASHRAA